MAKKPAQNLRDLFGELAFHDGRLHQLHPAIARGLIDSEWCVSHAKLRMTATLEVILGTAEAKDQKQPEAFFCGGKIIRGVHGAKNAVVRDLAIKASHQPGDAIRANVREEFVLGQQHCKRPVDSVHEAC